MTQRIPREHTYYQLLYRALANTTNRVLKVNRILDSKRLGF
jgi:hypothetical protein